MKRNDIQKKIMLIVSEETNHSIEDIQPAMTFKELGADSLCSAEIILRIEEEFNIYIPDDKSNELNSVKKLIDYTEIILCNKNLLRKNINK